VRERPTASATSAREETPSLANTLHGFPAAQGAGGSLAGLRNNAGDLLLERNQAVRSALLDVQHLTTLLGYVARLAATRGDDRLADFHRRWEARLGEVEATTRAAAIELGCEPAAAVAPVDVVERLGAREVRSAAVAAGLFDYAGRRSTRVPLDGCLRLGGCFHRAPEPLGRQRVELRLDRDCVWIAHREETVARYIRSYDRGRWFPPPPRPPVALAALEDAPPELADYAELCA
jgi:hypothetical protein